MKSSPDKKHAVWSFIKDTIFGYLGISCLEKDIIDTLPVQRLRRIKQLSGAEYAYPGANHTRFEHSIGVMHLAGEMARVLNEQGFISDEEIYEFKCAGLLHDVGHGPFSHNLEPHLIKMLGKTHEDFSFEIIISTEIGDILADAGIDKRKVAGMAVGRLNMPGKPFLDQIVASALDVDKMDYILRDSYHSGAEYGAVDIFRILYTVSVVDGNLAGNLTSLSALEAFIMARMFSFKSIYFHKVSRAAQLMITLAIEKASDKLELLKNPSLEEYLSWDDYKLWMKLSEIPESQTLMDDLRKRNLLKVAYEWVSHHKDEMLSRIFTTEKVRESVQQEIAEKADLPPENVIIDVPTLPSIPYRHSIELEPMEIPVFYEEGDRKIGGKLSEYSKIIEVMRGFYGILRVYSEKKYREKVQKAAKKVLGDPTLATSIHF